MKRWKGKVCPSCLPVRRLGLDSRWVFFNWGSRGCLGFAETDRNCLGRNVQPQFYAAAAIPLFHSCTLAPLQLVEPTLLDQCFSTGVPRNLRASRVAARVPPKQTKFAWDGIRLLHIVRQTLGSLHRVPWATQIFAEGSAAAKGWKTLQ